MRPLRDLLRATHAVMRVLLVVLLVAPIFWAMLYKLWLPFTPPWFDALSMTAAGLSMTICWLLGLQRKSRREP